MKCIIYYAVVLFDYLGDLVGHERGRRNYAGWLRNGIEFDINNVA